YVFFLISLFLPAMSFANANQRCQYIIPCLLFMQHLVGEHTTVPSDVLKSLCQLTVLVAQPITGIVCNTKFPVRVIRQTMPSGLVVRSRPENRTIILGHMEVDRPRTEGFGQCLKSFLQRPAITPLEIGRHNPVVGLIVSQQAEARMRHICLKAQTGP